MFRNDETLYRTTLARNPDCWMAHMNLALCLENTSAARAEAIAHALKANRLRPDDAKTYLLYGRLLSGDAAQKTEAMAQFQEAVRLAPDDAAARVELGLELAQIPGRLPGGLGAL
jgi:tetratricopeptide (TPR) repeat protein